MALFACVAAFLVATRLTGLPGTRADGVTPEKASSCEQDVAADTHDDSEAHEVVSKPSVRDLLVSAEMRRIYFVNMVAASSWDLFIVMMPVLGHKLGFSASVIGTVFSMFAIGTFAARAVLPWLSKHYREWQIMRTALIVITLVYALFPLAAVAPALMVLGLFFGCAVGMSQPNILSLLHTSAPAGRGGEAVGLRSVLSNGVSVVIPLVFGAAVVPVGIAGLLWAGAGLFGLGVWPAHRGVKGLARE